MINLIIYLGIGAVFHLVFIGDQFDFQSAWTWFWLFGWPVVLLACLFLVSMTILIIEAVSDASRQ